jgi:ABC-type antimicrobial peptide transport system permease subunit
VVTRNTLERRGELAILLAVGFVPSRIKLLVMLEHLGLLVLGLLCGLLAAGLAVGPIVLQRGQDVPGRQLAVILGALLLGGVVWTAIATWLALRGPLLNALRNE